jgi:hypothetical protein
MSHIIDIVICLANSGRKCCYHNKKYDSYNQKLFKEFIILLPTYNIVLDRFFQEASKHFLYSSNQLFIL